MRIIILLLLLLITATSHGREIAGVQVEETLVHPDGTQLFLNGAGIRSKFIVKVYIAQLYLAKKQSDTEGLLGNDSHRRVVMHFLYDEVKKDALVKAWNDGFRANGSGEQLDLLGETIETFNTFFETVHKGDQIVLDYIPGKGTIVFIEKEKKGTIEGKDFNDLLLSIWVGEKPVGKGLRDALLGK